MVKLSLKANETIKVLNKSSEALENQLSYYNGSILYRSKKYGSLKSEIK